MAEFEFIIPEMVRMTISYTVNENGRENCACARTRAHACTRAHVSVRTGPKRAKSGKKVTGMGSIDLKHYWAMSKIGNSCQKRTGQLNGVDKKSKFANRFRWCSGWRVWCVWWRLWVRVLVSVCFL
jgi:hypothetical protein